MNMLYFVGLIFVCTTQPNALKDYDASRNICEKSPTYPRYRFIDTSIKDNLQQNRLTIHQYPACTKDGHRVIRQSFKHKTEIIYKLEISSTVFVQHWETN